MPMEHAVIQVEFYTLTARKKKFNRAKKKVNLNAHPIALFKDVAD